MTSCTLNYIQNRYLHGVFVIKLQIYVNIFQCFINYYMKLKSLVRLSMGQVVNSQYSFKSLILLIGIIPKYFVYLNVMHFKLLQIALNIV